MLELVGGSLYQWDLDRKMLVTDETTVSEIHFANIGDSMALQVEPKEVDGQTIVNIPNELLQTSRNLVAYVFVYNQTVQKFIFEVNSRPKPAGYVYTESEILKWNSLDDRIKALEESGGGVEDYDQLINKPIHNVSSNESNMVAICELESGVYRFSGAFTPYPNSNIYYNFSKNQLVNIITASAGTHVQSFYPDNNTVQFCAIMRDDSAAGGWTVEEKDVCLNDLPALISAVGSLDNLNTTAKDNLVAAINEASKSDFSGSYNDLTDKPTIPSAVTDEHINSLIDAKLGVIENGSY